MLVWVSCSYFSNPLEGAYTQDDGGRLKQVARLRAIKIPEQPVDQLLTA
jgi:hypothetical protein